MRIRDVVARFAANITRHTDLFSTLLSGSATVAGQTVTVTTATPHGLETGDLVALPDRLLSNPITAVESVEGGYRFTSAAAHDLTTVPPGYEIGPYHATARLAGFADAAWNGEKALLSVPNRNQFVVAGPNLPTLVGGETLREAIEVGALSAPVAVTVTSPTTFTFALDVDPAGRGVVAERIVADVRVAGLVEFEEIERQYTPQTPNALWAFVVPSDVDLSKDRRANTDAGAELRQTGDMRATILDGFSLFVLVPTGREYSGLDALDLCRHDLLGPILKAFYGARFETGTAASTPYACVLTGHSVESYQKAFLIYRYDFQSPYQLVNADATDDQQTVAFRNIVMNTDLANGTRFASFEVNLDEAP